MKKIFLSVIFLFIMILSAISQSFVGKTSTDIKNSVLKEYSGSISNMSNENNILTITFTDSHVALYFFNSSDLCKYYALCYPNYKLDNMTSVLNNNFKKIENTTIWYYKDGEYYIYYKLIMDKDGKVFWIFVYPDFFSTEINQIIDSL